MESSIEKIAGSGSTSICTARRASSSKYRSGCASRTIGFFGMVDHFRGEAGLIVLDQGDFVFSWNIGGGDDREFAPRNAVAEADAADAPSRDAAAHGHAVQHFRKGEVVHVPGAARHFFPPLFAEDGMSKEFFFHVFRACVAPAFRQESTAAQRSRPVPRFSIPDPVALFAPIRETARAPLPASSARTEFYARGAGASILRR